MRTYRDDAEEDREGECVNCGDEIPVAHRLLPQLCADCIRLPACLHCHVRFDGEKSEPLCVKCRRMPEVLDEYEVMRLLPITELCHHCLWFPRESSCPPLCEKCANLSRVASEYTDLRRRKKTEPTKARPSTPQKVRVLQGRWERGEELHHEDDLLGQKKSKRRGSILSRSLPAGMTLRKAASDGIERTVIRVRLWVGGVLIEGGTFEESEYERGKVVWEELKRLQRMHKKRSARKKLREAK